MSWCQALPLLGIDSTNKQDDSYTIKNKNVNGPGDRAMLAMKDEQVSQNFSITELWSLGPENEIADHAQCNFDMNLITQK